MSKIRREDLNQSIIILFCKKKGEEIVGKRIYLNNDWMFQSSFDPVMLEEYYDEQSMEKVRLPHTNTVTPFHYFDDQVYQFVSCYRRKLVIEKGWKNKRILLTFEGVAHVATVYLDGVRIGKHEGGYTAFTFDLEPHLDFDKENPEHILIVEVDSRESNNLPPFGNLIDYMTYGGIYREVYLEVKDKIAIEEVFLMTKELSHPSQGSKGDLYIEKEADLLQVGSSQFLQLQLKLYEEPLRSLDLIATILNAKEEAVFSERLIVDKTTLEAQFEIPNVLRWDIDNPVLYQLKLELVSKSEVVDDRLIRFGFRTCEFRADGFYLNHRKIKLIGLNRHQSYPYVGYAMPKRMQQRDAEILKQELKVNIVRTAHYPQSQHFIDRCDELGLLVFTELPGWQHIGDEAWKQLACNMVQEMLLQYRNHPSIILWGVRINESQDDDAFYKRTNQLAHELDPGRQTGGVRYIQKSNLLEDVYTYNDFLHNGKTRGLSKKSEVSPKSGAPYLVTEFNGHMFPTKAFDNEEYRLEHALRHARVLEASFEQTDIAGAIGWCMFDYNTHKDFGSGDRICYHGVMDMFRNPKTAAAVYASQSVEETICEISSSLDIGEHPAGNLGDIQIFTNADSIRLYKNDTFIKEFYPNRKEFKNLLHPPVLIDDFIGNLLEEEEHFSHKTAETIKKILFAVRKYGPNHLPLQHKISMGVLMIKERLTMEKAAGLYYKYIGGWGGAVTTFRFEAIKDNQVVKVINKSPSSSVRLSVKVGATTMVEENTYDVAEIRILAIDENGNKLPYYQEPIVLKTWGAIELIGPEVISLKGGMGGTYIKTIGEKGEGGITLKQADLGVTEIKFNVI
jgi:beta-galactosidase